MKKSYKKILILEIALIIAVLFNSFEINKYNDFIMIGILLIGFIVLKFLLGWEKGKYRYTKDMVLSIIIFTVIVLLIMYGLGIFCEFIKPPSYLNANGLLKYIIPTGLLIIISEVFRTGLIRKSEGSKILFVMTTILFIVVDNVLLINSSIFDSAYTVLIFIAYDLLPSIVSGILCTYLCYKCGCKPAIIYRLIMEMYFYILPIYPNFGDYINSMIRILVPAIMLYISYRSLKDEKSPEIVGKKKNSLLNKILSVGSIVIITGMIYLISANFTYFSLAIGSGSMTPHIHKGDVVIAKKLKEKEKQEVKIGDVLVYQYGKTTIVHRIADIYKDKHEFIVYTKGDANKDIDNYPIYESMMVGIVKCNIPLIGFPSVLINEGLNK